MTSNTKLKPRSAPSLLQPAPISSVIPLKQTPGSNENGQKPFPPIPIFPVGITDSHQDEYEITCEISGAGVGFRNEEAYGTALKHHRLTCSTHGQSSNDPVIYTPESIVVAHPIKFRREKRTEQERINYLRTDPYVAQFEEYRVLCASCDKWIRLRSNSTYCTTSWDAHKKRCLARRVNSKNVPAIETRKPLVSRYPYIRKSDAESVLYNIRGEGLGVNLVQKRLQHHRTGSQKNSTPMLPLNQPILPEPVSVPQLIEQQMAVGPELNSFCGVPSPLLPHSVTRVPSAPIFAESNNAQPRNHPSDNSSFHGCNSSNHGTTHEPWKRNAQKQAATLGLDLAHKIISPRRTICSQCQKWDQLCQHSQYYAYPWLQYRVKCLARHASDYSSFQPPYAHDGHVHHRDTAVGIEQQPNIVVENPISEANCYRTLSENTNGQSLTSTYDHNPELQSLFRNNVQSSYHLGDAAVDSTARSPTVASTSTYYVTHEENTDRPAFTNSYTTQEISGSGLGFANHLIPHVENSNTLDPEPQTLLNSVNNVQPLHYPNNPAVDSIALSRTMGVEVPTLVNHHVALRLDGNTDMYSRVSDGNTVYWYCNLSGCQYVSRSKRDMERHCSNLRHGGCREHLCEYCGKMFVREDTLSRHIKETRCWLQ